MILSDQAIKTLLDSHVLTIDPMEPEQIQPASVDIRLGHSFSIVEDFCTGILSLDKEIPYKSIQTDTYLLLPGQFVLATSMEYIKLPDAVPWGASVFSSKMLAGWILALKVKLHWSSLMQTAGQLNSRQDGALGSWYLHKQICRFCIHTRENTSVNEAPLVLGYSATAIFRNNGIEALIST